MSARTIKERIADVVAITRHETANDVALAVNGIIRGALGAGDLRDAVLRAMLDDVGWGQPDQDNYNRMGQFLDSALRAAFPARADRAVLDEGNET